MERAFWDKYDNRSLLSAAFGISRDAESPVFFAAVAAFLSLSIPVKSTKYYVKTGCPHFKMVNGVELWAGERKRRWYWQNRSQEPMLANSIMLPQYRFLQSHIVETQIYERINWQCGRYSWWLSTKQAHQLATNEVEATDFFFLPFFKPTSLAVTSSFRNYGPWSRRLKTKSTVAKYAY